MGINLATPTIKEFTCAECGVIGQYLKKQSGRDRKYCSKGCGQKAANRSHPKWGRYFKTKDCIQCNQPYKTGHVKRSKFCSPQCGHAYYRDNASHYEFTCVVCGENGTDYSNNNARKYCSSVCAGKANSAAQSARRRILLKQCRCGLYFVSRGRYKYCGGICKRGSKRERSRGHEERRYWGDKGKPTQRPCIVCGTMFGTPYGDQSPRRVCSDVCAQERQRFNSGKRTMREIMIGGTDLDIADLPKEYVEAVELNQRLKQLIKEKYN